MTNTVPKKITDKNGKPTTVHVRAGDATSPKNSRKVPAAPINANEATVTALRQDIQTAIDLLNTSTWKKFPLEMQEKAVEAVNNPDADESVFQKGRELAEACESWNFHATSLKLSAGIARSVLAKNPDAEITDHYALGFDPATPPELLERVYKEAGFGAHSLTKNTSTPTHILDEFAAQDIPWMRENVAKNTSTSLETLDKLSKDYDQMVRYWLTENKSTPTYILNVLSKDSDSVVSLGAKKALGKRR